MKPLVKETSLFEHRRGAAREGMARALLGAPADEPATDQPDLVRDRLAELALLHGVPFEYLVPDARLLPPESVRFFTLDAKWIAALRQGVLSVGETSSVDRATRYRSAPQATAQHVLSVRDRRQGRPRSGAAMLARTAIGGIDAVTGFLLRSTAVTAYPGLQVRAYASTDPAASPLPLVRLDRPSTGVLLAMFGGAASVIVLEEPHHGIRLGVDASGSDFILQLRARDGRLIGNDATPLSVNVPLRAGGAGGVLDIAALAQKIAQAGAAKVPSPMTSSALALQLLQPPVRQRFVRVAP